MNRESAYASIVGQDEEELIKIFEECEQEIAKGEEKNRQLTVQLDKQTQWVSSYQKAE